MRKLPWYWLVLALGAGLFWFTLRHNSQIEFHSFSLTYPNGTKHSVEFPLSIQSQSGQALYILEGTLELGRFSSKTFTIVPDDQLVHLHIDNRPIDLSQVPAEQKSDFNTGFAIDLDSVLNHGTHQVQFHYVDRGGMMGVKMWHHAHWFTGLLSNACIVACITFVFLFFGLSKLGSLAIGIGIALRLLYVTITGPDVRGHDTWEHIQYIDWFLQHALPPPLDYAKDGAYFHPPLYYMIAAWFQKALQLIGINDPAQIHKGFQYLSLLFSVGFLVYGIRLIDRIVRGPARLLALLVFVTWPAAVMHSTRIGNDSLLYFFFTASLYYIVVWFETHEKKFFGRACLFTALAIVAKANGIIPAVALAMLIPVVALLHPETWAWKNMRYGILWLLPVCAAAAITFYPGMALKAKGERDNPYVDNITNVSSALIVGNEARNYLWLDIKTFVQEPFTSPWDDNKGRQYFPNYLAKTGLVGEWTLSGKNARDLATFISVLFLSMIPIAIYGLFRIPTNALKVHIPLLLVSFLLLAGVVSMRIGLPVNIDFRYILPILLPGIIWLGSTLQTCFATDKMRVGILGSVVLFAFAVSSVLLVLQMPQ